MDIELISSVGTTRHQIDTTHTATLIDGGWVGGVAWTLVLG